MSQELISRSRLVCFATAQRGRWLTPVVILLVASHIVAQATLEPIPSAEQSAPQLNVNWLHGAYVPKDAPLEPLSHEQRFKLYLRQSSPRRASVKTLLFSVGDQINDSPPAWGSGFGGYALRVGSRQAQFVMQNSFVALGNGILGMNPDMTAAAVLDSGRGRLTL